MRWLAHALDLVVAEYDDFDDELAKRHLELGLLVGSDVAVDEDTVNKVIQNSLPEKEFGQVEVVVEGLGPFSRLHALSTCGIADTQLLVEPPEDPLPHFGDRDREKGLHDIFELADS